MLRALYTLQPSLQQQPRGAPHGHPSYTHSCRHRRGRKPGRSWAPHVAASLGTGSTARGSPAATFSGRRAELSHDTPADRAGGHAKQGPIPQAGCASTGEALSSACGDEAGRPGEAWREPEGARGARTLLSPGSRARRGPHAGNRGVSPTARATSRRRGQQLPRLYSGAGVAGSRRPARPQYLPCSWPAGPPSARTGVFLRRGRTAGTRVGSRP